ncbi:hypothetical protein EDD17DRAFT_1756462 [Pisolithus thermaeus]|nr:hypothetical protein EDD17DRAFT_1756462 [Pisolithus thermaeus]
MYAAKFAVFSIITVFIALASASPVPVAAPEAAVDPVLAKTELLAREPLPVAEAVAERTPVVEVEDVEELDTFRP